MANILPIDEYVKIEFSLHLLRRDPLIHLVISSCNVASS